MANPTDVARDMVQSLDLATQRNGHIGLVRRYLKGEHDLPYMPSSGGTEEYLSIARRSISNWLPLVASTFTKTLFVDGYATGKSEENAEQWAHWQRNGMDARQTVAHRGAIEYGTSYVMVRPGDKGPVIKPLKARRSLAWYADDDDDFPEAGLVWTGTTLDGEHVYELYMGSEVYTFVREGSKEDRKLPNDPMSTADGPDRTGRFGGLTLVTEEAHGMGDFVPWVRFRDRLDDEAAGLIRPLIPLQNHVNEATFAKQMLLQFEVFKQKWGSGLEIPRDKDELLPDGSTNPNFGKPIEAYKAAVDRLWIAEDPQARFGSFESGDIAGPIRAYDSSVESLSANAEISPALLRGNIENVPAEGFATLNDSMNKKRDELRTLFGESWEQVFLLTALAAKETPDESAEVRWRDNEPKSFESVTQGLSNLYNIGAPAEELFEMVPGMTEQRLERWRKAREKPSDVDRLASALSTRTEPAE